MVKIQSFRWIHANAFLRVCQTNHFCENMTATEQMEIILEYCGNGKELTDEKLYEMAKRVCGSNDNAEIEHAMYVLNKFGARTEYTVEVAEE